MSLLFRVSNTTFSPGILYFGEKRPQCQKTKPVQIIIPHRNEHDDALVVDDDPKPRTTRNEERAESFFFFFFFFFFDALVNAFFTLRFLWN